MKNQSKDRGANGHGGLCLCGCKKHARRDFLPGHDSKLHSIVLRVVRGEAGRNELPRGVRVAEYLKNAPWMTPEIRKAIRHHA